MGPQRLQRPHFILCFFLVLHCDCLAKNRISWLEHSRLKFCLVISNYTLSFRVPYQHFYNLNLYRMLSHYTRKRPPNDDPFRQAGSRRNAPEIILLNQSLSRFFTPIPYPPTPPNAALIKTVRIWLIVSGSLSLSNMIITITVLIMISKMTTEMIFPNRFSL